MGLCDFYSGSILEYSAFSISRVYRFIYSASILEYSTLNISYVYRVTQPTLDDVPALPLFTEYYC
jgi:hypothetical protein